ncbi:RAP domain-containing protein [Endozoicomonas sp. GU-1]|uniref:RAP domain-containing protein n=1 Tax=Endozoicomonas sp. GU-1 TaxID=3009078 RepID=UPI0022B5236B|nr:RAP domain-containing protein [Endozoicomonas sp. GU-1]WBA85089.1 hypothetical protein O3276_17715 [Endozoicomonas sp. GU-1]
MMDRGGAGISWQCTTSGNDYNQPDDCTDSSKSGGYWHGPVRQVNAPLAYIQKRNEYRASDSFSANHAKKHSIKPVHDFNALITQERMDYLLSISARYSDRYDGKKHSQFATVIKQYTSASRRPLHHSEQRQLIPLLHNFKATSGWTWRSLTTTLHSFTSAGVFTPHKYMSEGSKETQKALLSTLLVAVIRKCNQKTETSDIDAQGSTNLLWAVAKLVDNGLELEKTPRLKEAVAALLPKVKTKAESKEVKDHFIPQHISNLLWAVAKLVDNGLEITPKLKGAVAALLPYVTTNAESKEDKDHFKPQEVVNLLWALAKLVGNGLELENAAQLKEAVAALLLRVKTKAESKEDKEDKDHFKPQHLANLLWALAKLVDNGLELENAVQLKEALVALLPRVKTKAESTEEQDHFKPQDLTNLLWALAKLVDNGLALRKAPKLKESVAALLPLVKTKAESTAEKDRLKPQEVANLLWALAKLVDNGLELEKTATLKEAMAALLLDVKTKAESKEEKDLFIPQHIANLLWAVATLVGNGLELEKTPKLKEAMAALLLDVKTKAESKEEKDLFIPQHIASLLWSVAKLGEAIELNLVKSMFDSLANRISEHPQLSQQDISMALWGVMVFSARYYLYFGDDNKNTLEKHIDELFSRLESPSPCNTEFPFITVMAASWLGRACPVGPHYQTITSQSQAILRDQLQSSLPSLKIKEEQSLNSLPPVDLQLPDYNVVIDVQGPSHYVSGDFKTRNGSTLLKVALLKRLGFEVIEIPVDKLWKQDSMTRVIEQIKTKLAVSPETHGPVSPDSNEWVVDEAYFTADEGGQFSDNCYVTAEEYLEEQINKPKKRKRKRKKPVKTAVC